MHIVQCRVCKAKIDTDATNDWMMPTKNYYYHCNCYHEWLSKREERVLTANYTDEEWKSLLFDYLWKDLKLPGADFEKITNQWNHFVTGQKHFTPKGIYFAILYYYDVQHGDPSKAQGGIGIVSSIYNDSAEYWAARERKREGTLNDIVKQMAERAQREVTVISNNKKPRRAKPKFNLEDV